MSKPPQRLGLLFLGVLLLAGCGPYHLGTTLPDNMRTVFVPTFVNRTNEPGIEIDVTNAVITRFRVDGNLAPVSEKEADLFAAIKFGARGYILKNADPEELVQAIFHVARGGVIVSAPMATKLLDEFRAQTGAEAEAGAEAATLSQREGDVLQLVAQGASNKEIAASLFISENTVKTHLRNILDKLHLVNRSQAAAYAVRAGLIPPEPR